MESTYHVPQRWHWQSNLPFHRTSRPSPLMLSTCRPTSRLGPSLRAAASLQSKPCSMPMPASQTHSRRRISVPQSLRHCRPNDPVTSVCRHPRSLPNSPRVSFGRRRSRRRDAVLHVVPAAPSHCLHTRVPFESPHPLPPATVVPTVASFGPLSQRSVARQGRSRRFPPASKWSDTPDSSTCASGFSTRSATSMGLLRT